MRKRQIMVELLMTAAGLGWIALPAAPAAVVVWNGGDGDWNVPANWNNETTGTNTVPTSSDNVYIQSHDPETISIGAGVSATANRMYIRYAQTVTLSLADTASITIPPTGDYWSIGAHDTDDGSKLTIQGPSTGSATANLHRLYFTKQSATPNVMTLSGNLTANLDHDSELSAGNVLVITGGASLGGDYKLAVSKSGDTHANRLSIQNGHFAASNINSWDNGLVQLGQNGTLSLIGGKTSLSDGNLQVRSGSRFEAEGGGLDDSGTDQVYVRVYATSTLAVGVADPDPVGATADAELPRTAAAELSLNTEMYMESGSYTEFGIFSDTDSDQINLGSAGRFDNHGSILQLVLHGFTPQSGDAYQLFTGNNADNDTNGVTGDFDLSGIDTSLWDVSQFNAAGGWMVVWKGTSIPEPMSLALLAIPGGLMVMRRRRPA